jgi:hypothetical protein
VSIQGEAASFAATGVLVKVVVKRYTASRYAITVIMAALA